MKLQFWATEPTSFWLIMMVHWSIWNRFNRSLGWVEFEGLRSCQTWVFHKFGWVLHKFTENGEFYIGWFHSLTGRIETPVPMQSTTWWFATSRNGPQAFSLQTLVLSTLGPPVQQRAFIEILWNTSPPASENGRQFCQSINTWNSLRTLISVTQFLLI